MRQDSLGIAKQTGSGDGGLGTKQTTMEYFVPVETAETGEDITDMTIEETLGNPFPTDHEHGTIFWSPKYAGACRGASLPRILSGFLGDPLTTTPGGGTTSRNHNFEPVARPIPRAHSILLNRTDPAVAITDLLWDAVGNELALKVETDDWMKFEASYVARDIDEARPEPTVTTDYSRRFAYYESKVYISIDGAGETEISVGNWGLTYGLDVDTDNKVLGSQRLFRNDPRNRTAELTFQPKDLAAGNTLASFYRAAQKVAAAGTGARKIKVRLEALGPIIEGAINHKVEIIAHRCTELSAPADIDAGSRLTGIDVTAAAAYDSSTSKFVEANVVNTVTVY